MEQKNEYKNVQIDVIALSSADVLTTSEGTTGTGSGNITNDGWTPLEW